MKYNNTMNKIFDLTVLILIFNLLYACVKKEDDIEQNAIKITEEPISESDTYPEIEEESYNVKEYDYNSENAYSIQRCFKFNNDIAWIVLKEGQSDASKYAYAVVNTKGEIISKFTFSDLTGLENHSFWDSFLDRKENNLPPYNVIINNESGTIVATANTHNFQSIGACGDGYYMVCKEIKNYDENKSLIGILDDSGEWILPLSEVPGKEYSTSPSMYYFGDGIFGVATLRTASGHTSYLLYDTKTSSWSKEITSQRPFVFNDGYAIIGDGYTRCLIDSQGNSYEIKDNPFYCGDYSEGMWYSGTTCCFYDKDNNVVLDISEYKDKIGLGQPYFDNGYCLLKLNGADGNSYFTVIDKSGKQLFEPQQYISICDSISCKRIVTSQNIFDFNGESIQHDADNYEMEGYYDGFIRCNDATNFMDSDGSLLFERDTIIIE